MKNDDNNDNTTIIIMIITIIQYKGITIQIGNFHAPDPPEGNEYSDCEHGNDLVMFGSRKTIPVVSIALYMIAKLAYRERAEP